MAGLFHWGARRAVEAPVPEVPSETTATSLVLPKFLSAVGQRSSPVLLDLGPVVGANVTFFGDRLACKLLVGDLFRDIAAASSGPPAVLRESLITRLTATVTMPLDGVLCWDVFDFLDRATAQALAGFLASRVSPGGVVHGLFGTTPVELTCRTRYVVKNATTLATRCEPIDPVKRSVLSTRDLALMFTGFTVAESVLLKSQRRETLLRKA